VSACSARRSRPGARIECDVEQRQRHLGLEAKLAANALGGPQVANGILVLAEVDQDVAEILPRRRR